MPEATVAEMKRRLAVLDPVELAIEDESALHAGHPGAAGGGGTTDDPGECRIRGQPRVARHRLVYDALAELMHREIHASR